MQFIFSIMADNNNNKSLLVQEVFNNNSKEAEKAIKVESARNANINDLPNEMLSQILKLIPFNERVRNERVCQRWRWIAFSSMHSPWLDVHKLKVDQNIYLFFDHQAKDKLENAKSKLTQIVLACLKRIGSNLRELTIITSNNFGDFYRLAAPWMPKLELLKIECIDAMNTFTHSGTYTKSQRPRNSNYLLRYSDMHFL